jgi:hypothetical protein
MWTEIAERRAANMRLFRRRPGGGCPLAPGPWRGRRHRLAASAARCTSLLVGRRGWSLQLYERFLADT